MEPVPFRGIEMGFGFGEKVLVILHGLPVLDHKVYLLVVFGSVKSTTIFFVANLIIPRITPLFQKKKQ